MLLYIPLLFLVTISASQANDGEPCRCYPDKMSGRVEVHGRKAFDFMIDYEQNLVMEVYRSGKVIRNLGNNKIYRLRKDGECTVSDLTNHANYAQCVPDAATLFLMEDNAVSYEYTLPGDIWVVKTMNKATCVPMQGTKSKDTKSLTLDYVAEPTVDESAFDVDLSHCE